MSIMSRLISKNSLRMIKYQLNDDYSSLKYWISSIKTKSSNPKQVKETEILNISYEEKKDKYIELINKNQELTDLYPFSKNSPLVSMIINFHDSSDFKRLFKNFMENLNYPNVEVVLINNSPSTQYEDYFLKIKNLISLEVVENNDGLSYSEIHNITVDNVNGDYLLFLDSDLMTSPGWLNSLIQTALENRNTGCVGAKVVYADFEDLINPKDLFKIQSIGTEFIENHNGTFKTTHMGERLDPFNDICSKKSFRAALSKNVLLISKKRFLDVGGFDENYGKQLQDIDLCLKLLKKGYNNIYSPNSLLFNFSHDFGDNSNNKTLNSDLKLFNERWDNFLGERVLMDRLENNKVFSLRSFKIGFAVSEKGENVYAGDYFTAQEFGDALKNFGWEVSFLSRTGPENWYDVEDLDAVISLLYTFDPRRIRFSSGSLIKIAWPRNWFDRWVFFPWFKSYDLVFAPSKSSLNYVKNKSTKKPILLPLATNPNRFNNKIQFNEKYSSDYCFTGSYWNDPRDIIDLLEPDQLPYTFALYGKNWDQIPKFEPYNRGFINYSNMPLLYASTKIVIDDANRATKIYGSVNSRVYDALASGALVLTNGTVGAEEIFNNELPVFESREELNNLLKYYLENDTERIMLVKKLQTYVLENHTYFNRAKQLKQTLIKYVQNEQI